MFNLADRVLGIERLVGEIIRVGVVVSTDDEAGTARVRFGDRNGLVSFNLPVLVRNARKNKDYWMPDINEQVLCIFLPIGIEKGWILGSFYSKATTPPTNTKNKRLVEFEDGTVLEYDRETHTLTANVQGNVVLVATGTVSLTAPTTNIVGNVNITGSLTATGDVSDGVGSMQTIRDIYNIHVHDKGGGSTTQPPDEQM